MLRRLYRRIHHISDGVRQRLTPLGGWLFGGWVVAGALGFNTRVGVTYHLFMLLTALFAVAWFASRFGKMPVRGRRELPRFATVDQPVRYRLSLHNPGRRVQTDLSAMDRLESSVVQAPKRLLSYRQWAQKNRWARGALTQWQPLPPIPPAGQIQIDMTLTPVRRGWLEFTALHMARPEPLGLWRRVFAQTLPDRLLVLPRRYPLAPLHFHNGRRYQRGGIHLAQSVGEEDEFVGLRDYRPGDPPRRIHWRSFAKRGEPVVKEFQDEFFVRYGLLLDCFATDLDEACFEAAVSAAASVVAADRSPDALLDLLFVGDRAYCFTAGRGLGQTESLLHILACVQLRREPSLGRLCSMVAEHATTLSACVCILLEWDKERQQLLNLLRVQGVDIMAFVIGSDVPAPSAEPGVHFVTPETLAKELARLAP
jgi:uncharacterized protein (DUF58 family)